MHYLVAPNALKGSLTAVAAAEAIRKGIQRGDATATVACVPIADGGDGTADVITQLVGGELNHSSARDPLGRPRNAAWGDLPGAKAAVDLASASGIALISEKERDPMNTTTYGTGELIAAAVSKGAKHIVLGVGGSATVDGGAGLLQALGVALLDAHGNPIPRGGSGLAELDRLDVSGVGSALRDTRIEVACDVTNPLLGEHGAARVFGPQKGADDAAVETLERNLAHMADIVERDLGVDVRTLRHGGAAGGVAAMLHGVLGAELRIGIDLVLELAGFEEELTRADVVVTAEGWLDAQTLDEKGPYGVARAAKARGVPVVALAGGIEDSLKVAETKFFDALISVCHRPMQLEYAIEHAEELIDRAGEQLARLLSLPSARKSGGYGASHFRTGVDRTK